MTTFFIILAIYLIGAVATYGFARADMDEFRLNLMVRWRWSDWREGTSDLDRGNCIFAAVFWVFALFGVLAASEKGARNAKWRLISKLPSNKEQ